MTIDEIKVLTFKFKVENRPYEFNLQGPYLTLDPAKRLLLSDLEEIISQLKVEMVE